MSVASYPLRDSTTMLRRNLVRMRRYPSLTLMLIGIPVILLLLFVYVFGGTMGAGIGAVAGASGRAAYANYLTPGILLIAIAGVAQGVAIGVAMDMTEGIIARFRTMAIFRPSVLNGHVIGAMIQTVLGLAVVTGVSMLVGFRPNATFVEWLAAAGILLLTTYAIIWLSVACGLVAKTVESASNIPMPLILLPFLGSGFVPTETMPTAFRWFAEYQPFTPIMETVRGLLLGTGIGNSAVMAVAWCLVIGVGSYVWSRHLFNRDPSAR